MTPPDYREQARALLRDYRGELEVAMAEWASRIAEERDREAERVLDLADLVTELAYPANEEWYASPDIVRAVTNYRRARGSRVSGGET